jgi:hypothetical protein
MGVKSEVASDVGRDNKTLGPCRRVDWGPGGKGALSLGNWATLSLVDDDGSV